STSTNEPVPGFTACIDGGIRGLRIGVIKELRSGLSDDVAKSFAAALDQLAALGAKIEEVTVPSIDTAPSLTGIVTLVEALEYHEKWMEERPRDYGDDVRTLLEMGMGLTATGYVRAQRARARMLADALKALDDRAVLIAPSAAIAA